MPWSKQNVVIIIGKNRVASNTNKIYLYVDKIFLYVKFSDVTKPCIVYFAFSNDKL